MDRKRSLPLGERTTKLVSAGELWDNTPKNSGDEYEPGQKSVEPAIEELAIQEEVISGVFTATVEDGQIAKIPTIESTGSMLDTKEEKQETSHSTIHPLLKRCGMLALCSLILGSIVIAGVAIFLGFLWFLNSQNRVWQWIMVHGWLTKLITISSLIIRFIVDLQAGFCTAMLAALTLESSGLLLSDVAQTTIIRAQPSSWKIFGLIQIQARRSRSFRKYPAFTLLVISMLALTTILIQLTSLALISDVGIGNLPGPNATLATAYARDPDSYDFDSVFQKGSFDTTWLQKPASYPPFAEYVEPSAQIDDVKDTGLTLRAFLPMSTVQARENIKSFSGKTTVLDSRVTCQAPVITDAHMQVVDELWGVVVTGQAWATVETPRMDNLTADFTNIGGSSQINNTGVRFSCIAFSDDLGSYGTEDQWRLSLCQLEEGGSLNHSGYSGGLISEFVSPKDYKDTPFKYGSAYLLLNFTQGKFPDWSPSLNLSDQTLVQPQSASQRGAWLDLSYHEPDLGEVAQLSTISLSLCYSAFNTTNLYVDIHSDRNRTELLESYDFNKAIYSYDSIRKQLGQTRDLEDDRGILSLQKKSSWIPHTDSRSSWWLEPTGPDFADMGGAGSGDGNIGNYTAMLWLASTQTTQQVLSPDYLYIVPHTSHILLFQEIIQSGGSVAFALQSVLTVLASMDFYNHLPTYNVTSMTEQSFFTLANIPLRSRGLMIVYGALAVHILNCVFVIFLFSTKSHFSELGNNWQSVAQIVGPETTEILKIASGSLSKDVKKGFQNLGRENLTVFIAEDDSTGSIGICCATKQGNALESDLENMK